MDIVKKASLQFFTHALSQNKIEQMPIEERLACGDSIGEVNSNYRSLEDLLILNAGFLIFNIFVRVLTPWITRPADPEKDEDA